MTRAQPWPWRTLLKMAVSAGLLAWLFSRVDPQVLKQTLASFRPATLALALALTLTGTALAAFRWWLLLPETRYAYLLRYSFIGQFYAFLLPGQIAGEAVKAWRISRGRADGPRVAASVTIDRAIGLLGLLAVGQAGLLQSSQPPARALMLPFALLLCALVMLLLFCGSAAAPRLSSRLLAPWLRRWPRLEGVAKLWLAFLDAWRTYLKAPLRLLASLVVAVIFQLTVVSIYSTLAGNLGIRVAGVDWWWIVAITSVAVLLPVSFAGIGLREGALVGCLLALSVRNEPAIALSLGVFALMACGAIIGGVLDLLDRPPRSQATR